MSIVRALVGLLIAAVLLGAPPAALAQASPPAIPQELRQEFRRGFIDGSDGMMRYFVEDYPTEYQAFETEILTALLQGKSVDSLRPRIVAVMTDMTPKLYLGIDNAPDRELLLWAQSQLDLGKALALFDPKTCRRLLEGETLDPAVHAVLRADVRTKEVVKRYVHASLEAARAGRRTPFERTPAVFKEMQPVIKAFRATKGDEAWLDVIGTPKLETLADDVRCRNNLIWTQSILTLPAPLAARILMTD